MVRRRLWSRSTAALAGLALAGCVQTSRVSDDTTPATLSQSKRAVAIMRIGSASPACQHAAVMLAQREGEGFRTKKAIVVASIRSVTESAVAETELDPGEYHVVAYSCRQEQGAKVVGDYGASSLYYRSSYASFTLAPGEMVNLGYLHLQASHVGRNAFGRPIRTDIDVTDWPLDEIDRYKLKRPAIYAQMTTRLMTVSPKGPADPSSEDCKRLEALQVEGKVQSLPAKCTPAPPPPAPPSPRSTKSARAG